jgi:hypothetical protein
MGDRSDGYVFWCVAAAAAVLGFHIFSFWFLNFLLSISIAWSPGIVSSGWWPRGHDPDGRERRRWLAVQQLDRRGEA